MLNELVSSAKAVAGIMATANAVHIRARTVASVLPESRLPALRGGTFSFIRFILLSV
jgi:hypothetical protein